jgi:diacylglycerol kinase family enzyme
MVTELRGAELRVGADRPFTVYADGDPIGNLPITLRALPAALRVLLPA